MFFRNERLWISLFVSGRKICSQPGQLFCNPKYPLYCISKDLVCDGKRNCPEGSDEEKELCSPGGNLEKSIMGKSASDTTQIGQDWEVVASEVLKKLIANDQRHLRKSDVTSTTERSMVIWSDDNSSGMDSFTHVRYLFCLSGHNLEKRGTDKNH